MNVQDKALTVVAALARMLGHADLQMLKKYVRLNKKPVIHASELYSVVDNLE